MMYGITNSVDRIGWLAQAEHDVKHLKIANVVSFIGKTSSKDITILVWSGIIFNLNNCNYHLIYVDFYVGYFFNLVQVWSWLGQFNVSV